MAAPQQAADCQPCECVDRELATGEDMVQIRSRVTSPNEQEYVLVVADADKSDIIREILNSARRRRVSRRSHSVACLRRPSALAEHGVKDYAGLDVRELYEITLQTGLSDASNLLEETHGVPEPRRLQVPSSRRREVRLDDLDGPYARAGGVYSRPFESGQGQRLGARGVEPVCVVKSDGRARSRRLVRPWVPVRLLAGGARVVQWYRGGRGRHCRCDVTRVRR